MPIESGNQLDKLTSPKMGHKRTKFPINGKLYNTYRFGEYGIAGCFNGIAGDKVKTRTHSTVDSYTLGAPLMSPIYMNKAWFMVPRMAILPRAWELIYTNPSIGQDIDATQYGTSVKGLYWNLFMSETIRNLNNLLNKAYYQEGEDLENLTIGEYLYYAMKFLTWNEYIFSNGSLINTLGAKFAKLWVTQNGDNFDNFYEKFWAKLIEASVDGFAIQENGSDNSIVWIPGTETTKETKASKTWKEMPFNMFISKLRDGDKFEIIRIYHGKGIYEWTTTLTYSNASIKNIVDKMNDLERLSNTALQITNWNKPIDIASCWAYQMSCAEFFTNDKVDYIYNASLYRDYIQNLIFELKNSKIIETYQINGIDYTVDALSAKNFQYVAESIQNLIPVEYSEDKDFIDITSAYLSALFAYRRSLRYKDYFTGARTRPLAIGDTDIPVQAGNYVDVVDVSKNIQKQRFLNVVNKIPRTLKGYTKAIAGKDVAPDWHNPLFIGMTKSVIYGTETENTGEAQMTEKVSRTTTLTGEGKYQFEFDLDRNCIIIGVTYFDIERAYSQGVRRSFFEVDRYDMFNPYLQYTGDQPIYKEEYNCEKRGTFGYTGAYMHMKQAVTEAAGGFITALKGWTFLDQYESETIKEQDHIGPDFIRSRPYELDKFYLSLSGTSLANYFHFIIEEDIIYEASRTMAYNPQIIF